MSWKTKAGAGIAAAFAVVALSAAGVPAANAAEQVELTNSQITELRSHWQADGVTDADQKVLLSKLEAGEKLESQTGATPVVKTTSTDSRWVTVTRRYADGSYSISKRQLPAPTSGPGNGVQPRSVTGCSQSVSGSMQVFTGCLIKYEDPSSWLSFYMNFRYLPGPGGYGQIDQVYGFNADIYIGTYLGGGVSIVKSTGTAANPAVADAHISYTLNGGGGGSASALTYVDQSGVLQGTYN